MTAAASNAALASPPPPGSGPALVRRPNLAAVKALMFPCLASLWVGGASAAAAAAILAVQPSGEGAPLVDTLMGASLMGILIATLLAKIVFTLLLSAALRDAYPVLEACGPKLRSMLRDVAWFGYAEALLFVVASLVGCVVVVEVSDGSRVCRIGALIIDVEAVACAAIACFDIIPSRALKLWRVKPSGATADGYIV
ncbi:hypothetical protein SEVIR_6G155000v4 [Setaria viridis]|uniref:Uncharacterized protein n=1 Tax=Setaria viridis TaxID=4556 RepID=A0A4U6U3Z9_SETVI|nr:uncharacterized protein LOC117861420 [Setaria viridis]XP_034600870.1 uncharacterized protein LOC117861420 [Setaria viridis]TKW10310.1 hypothetical protein SEVIR_6G155000v2 [Setaria viridis]